MKRIPGFVIFLLTLISFMADFGFAQNSERLFVVNKAGETISIVNARTLAVEHSIATGRNPHELAVAPDGSKIYVGNVAENTVSVIDLKTNREIRKIVTPDFKSPHGIAFTPDSRRAVVTSEGAKKIVIIDATTDQVIRAIDTDQGGTHMALVNKAGTLAYFTNRESNTVSFLDLSNYRIVANVPVGQGAEGFALSPDEKEIWAGNRNDGTLSIIDIPRRQTVATIPADAPIRVAFTPDGKHVLVPNGGASEVNVFDVVTRRKIKAIDVGRSPAGVVVAPDGARAYVSCQGTNEIQVIDTKTWAVVGKVAVGNGPDGIAFR
jgi:YVTN family beta-propeller protein